MIRTRQWEAALRGALSPAAAGAPVLVAVEGGAGTGKSRFVQWLLARPEFARPPHLTVRFTASGIFLHESARPDRSRLLRPDALEDDLLGQRAASSDTGTPVMLVAEDIHRADEQGARALRTVLSHPPVGLRAVLTYRPEELATPGLVLGAPVDYPAGLNLVHVRLGPLDEAEVGRMAVEALGEERCSPQFITRLCERTGGIAQTVVDLLAQLGAVRPPRGGDVTDVRRCRLTAKDVDGATVPVRLVELVVGRMVTLDEQQRRVVWAAAVLDEPASEEELTSVAALSSSDGRTALTAALSKAVLHQSARDRYGFRAPLEAAAVRRLLSGPMQRELHARAAEMLEADGPTAWARLARHYMAAGRTEQWLQSVEKAAREAAEAGDHEVTISLLEETLTHPEVPQPRRAELALILAGSALVGLPSDQTVEVLRRVVGDPALSTPVRGQIRLDFGRFLCMRATRYSEGRAELERAADELTTRPTQAVRAMARLAELSWPGGSLADSLTWLARAEAAAARSGDAAARAAVAADRMALLLYLGDPDGWRHLEQLPRDSEDLRVILQTARGLCNAADAAIWLGEYARAGELLPEGLKLCARSRAPIGERQVRNISVRLDLATGHWADLADRARAAEAEADDYFGDDARVALGLLALAKGDWAQAGTRLSDPCLRGDGGTVPMVMAGSGGRIRLALARDDVEGAAREAAEAWVRLHAKGVWVWAADVAPWAVEATARDGRLDTAREMVDEFATGIQNRQAPAAAAALLWCRGLLAQADKDRPSAAEHLRRARARFQSLPRPYEAALTAEAYGRCVLDGSHDTTGIAALEAAADELDTLGATWDVARVRAELRAHRRPRRPPGRPGYGGRLSPREQEVAALAGAGLTNREIAATLHLSPRTVEHHVAQALKKLGVLSRRDLAPTEPDDASQR